VTTVLLVVISIEIGGYLALRREQDRAHTVSALRLAAAMETFRPSEHGGLAHFVEPAELGPERSVRTSPSRCTPLTLLSVHGGVDGQSWTGVNGTPVQPVTTLTVRYLDASSARRELRDKEIALLRCRKLLLTFPPFDAPAKPYRVKDRLQPSNLLADRLSYTLVGDQKRYEFYVRRYANTLTWTYAEDVSDPQVRRQVADSLVSRLRQLDRE
jgi:hypothetical protein